MDISGWPHPKHVPPGLLRSPSEVRGLNLEVGERPLSLIEVGQCGLQPGITNP